MKEVQAGGDLRDILTPIFEHEARDPIYDNETRARLNLTVAYRKGFACPEEALITLRALYMSMTPVERKRASNVENMISGLETGLRGRDLFLSIASQAQEALQQRLPKSANGPEKKQ